MGRVQRPPVGLVPIGAHAAARHEEQIKKSKPEYKVHFEQITQKRKKLLALTTYKIQAPQGYTFIPLTAPELTEKCKDLSRQQGAQVHVVSTSKGGWHSTELSTQVGRVGHHFPSRIVATALADLGYDIDRSGRILSDFQKVAQKVGQEASRKDQKGTRIGDGITDPAKRKRAQEELNSEASKSLDLLFPNMPPKDKKAVIKHAFVIGKDRIGSTAELSMDRRVHLAVLAHIRHSYTDYDRLLKEVPYQTARSIVEKQTLRKIVEWRGEGDNDDGVEEILREVIVIDDDDHDDDVQFLNDLPLTDDDGGEIEFRSSPIAIEKIDSRPYAHVDYDYYASEEPSRYCHSLRVVPIDAERQRRYDDRRRDVWQEVKRSYQRDGPDAPLLGHTMMRHSNSSSGQVRHAQSNHVRTISQNSVGPGYSASQFSSTSTRPRRLILNETRNGHLSDVTHSRPIETGKYDADSPYRSPQTREVVYQSIERSPEMNSRPQSRPEVIVLDSPNERSAPPIRKRTLGELDSGYSIVESDDRYATKIVELGPAPTRYGNNATYESPTKASRIEYVSADRHPQYRTADESATSRNTNAGFFLRNMLSAARVDRPHVSALPQMTQRIYDGRPPLAGLDTGGVTNGGPYEYRPPGPGREVILDKSTMTFREAPPPMPYPREHFGQQSAPIAAQAPQYRQLIEPIRRDYRLPLEASSGPAGTAGTAPADRVHHNGGVQQHLQRLHFYEAPKTYHPLPRGNSIPVTEAGMRLPPQPQPQPQPLPPAPGRYYSSDSQPPVYDRRPPY